jgi:hypothetical protein
VIYFKLSSQRLEKMDDRQDHFVSCEQLVIIVIGVGQHEERLGSHRGIVEPPTVLPGHDPIAPAGDDQQRDTDSANLIDRCEPVRRRRRTGRNGW